MTQTLDWREALGDPRPASPPSGVRTVDFDSFLSEVDMARAERTSVRNVLVLGPAGGDHPWKARAAFDAVDRSLISWLPMTAGRGELDASGVSEHFVEWLTRIQASTLSGSHSRIASTVGSVGTPGEESAIPASALEVARQLALSAFPDGTTVEWSDDVDENDGPLKLMTVVCPASSEDTHEAYRAFIRSWVRAEPPERRRRIRVSCRAGAIG